MADDRMRSELEEDAEETYKTPRSKEGGYCPYTPDRSCKTGKSGGWSDSKECRECGWRAW